MPYHTTVSQPDEMNHIYYYYFLLGGGGGGTIGRVHDIHLHSKKEARKEPQLQLCKT